MRQGPWRAVIISGYRCTLVILLSCLLSVSARAEGITVSQSVDKTEVAFEDIVRYQITLTWQGPQSAYLFEHPVTPDFDRFKAGGFSTKVSSSGRGETETTTKTLTFTLIPRLPGTATISSVAIDYLSWPDSVAGQVSTEPVAVTIAEPVKQTADGSSESGGLVLVLMIGAAVLLSGGVAVFFMRRRSAPMPARAPVDSFLDDLAQLKGRAGSDVKEFQGGLYRLLVEFLQAHCQMELANKGSDDVTDCLEDTDLTITQKEAISGWLKRAEREKFQPASGAPGETIRLESEIRSFFEKQFR